ncbi:unnamed protein product [Prunus armeniaca]
MAEKESPIYYRLQHYFLAHKLQLIMKFNPVRAIRGQAVINMLALFPEIEESTLSKEVLQELPKMGGGTGVVLINLEGIGHFLLIFPPVIVTNSINRPAMGPEPKNLSHIQQSWHHWAYTKIERVAGRILEAQGSSKQVLIPVD